MISPSLSTDSTSSKLTPYKLLDQFKCWSQQRFAEFTPTLPHLIAFLDSLPSKWFPQESQHPVKQEPDKPPHSPYPYDDNEPSPKRIKLSPRSASPLPSNWIAKPQGLSEGANERPSQTGSAPAAFTPPVDPVHSHAPSTSGSRGFIPPPDPESFVPPADPLLTDCRTADPSMIPNLPKPVTASSPSNFKSQKQSPEPEIEEVLPLIPTEIQNRVTLYTGREVSRDLPDPRGDEERRAKSKRLLPHCGSM